MSKITKLIEFFDRRAAAEVIDRDLFDIFSGVKQGAEIKASEFVRLINAICVGGHGKFIHIIFPKLQELVITTHLSLEKFRPLIALIANDGNIESDYKTKLLSLLQTRRREKTPEHLAEGDLLNVLLEDVVEKEKWRLAKEIKAGNYRRFTGIVRMAEALGGDEETLSRRFDFGRDIFLQQVLSRPDIYRDVVNFTIIHWAENHQEPFLGCLRDLALEKDKKAKALQNIAERFADALRQNWRARERNFDLDLYEIERWYLGENFQGGIGRYLQSLGEIEGEYLNAAEFIEKLSQIFSEEFQERLVEHIVSAVSDRNGLKERLTFFLDFGQNPLLVNLCVKLTAVEQDNLLGDLGLYDILFFANNFDYLSQENISRLRAEIVAITQDDLDVLIANAVDGGDFIKLFDFFSKFGVIFNNDATHEALCERLASESSAAIFGDIDKYFPTEARMKDFFGRVGAVKSFELVALRFVTESNPRALNEAREVIARYVKESGGGLLLWRAKSSGLSFHNISRAMDLCCADYDLDFNFSLNDPQFLEFIAQNRAAISGDVNFLRILLRSSHQSSVDSEIMLNPPIFVRVEGYELPLAKVKDLVVILQLFPGLLKEEHLRAAAGNERLISAINRTLEFENAKYVSMHSFELFQRINLYVPVGSPRIKLESLGSFQDLVQQKMSFPRKFAQLGQDITSSQAYKLLQQGSDFREFVSGISPAERDALDLVSVEEIDFHEIARFLKDYLPNLTQKLADYRQKLQLSENGRVGSNTALRREMQPLQRLISDIEEIDLYCSPLILKIS